MVEGTERRRLWAEEEEGEQAGLPWLRRDVHRDDGTWFCPESPPLHPTAWGAETGGQCVL